MKTYRRGETPKIYANIYAESIDANGVLSQGALADPSSSVKIIIEDSSGEVVQALADMNKDDTGKYSYGVAGAYYTIPVTANWGQWNYDVVATSGNLVTKMRGSFEVVEEVV